MTRPEPVVNLGANLRRLREARGVSRADLAATFGVSGGAVTQWEQARVWPSLDRIVALADYYGITLDDLVLGDVRITTTVTVTPR